MKIIEKWNSVSLIIRIVCGLIIGAILGILVPHATGIALLGELFVGALKAIAPILVLVLVASSLANAKGGHAHKFRTVILLYLLSTMSASALAVIVNFLFPTFVPVDGVTASDEFTAPSGMAEVIGNLLKNIVANPVDAVLNANYIGILFWAVILGLALKRSSDGTKRFLDDLADAISKIVRGIISFAPFGILGLVFNSVSTSGLDIFVTYGHLVAVLVCTMLLVAFALNPLIVGLILRHNPYPLIWKCIRTAASPPSSREVPRRISRSTWSCARIWVSMRICTPYRSRWAPRST
jgi:serine/threonine transporter